MNELLNSALFWSVLAVFAAVVILTIDFVFRTVVDRRASEQERFRHRIANQLPRELHKDDHDEVLDLKGGTALARK